MKFDFTYDETLSLEIHFEEKDFQDYMDSFICLGSQLLRVDKEHYWLTRKTQVIHDIITLYIQLEHIEIVASLKIFVHVNDRGEVVSFKCNPQRHVQELGLCQLYHDCKLLYFLKEGCKLCECCGDFYIGSHKCTN